MSAGTAERHDDPWVVVEAIGMAACLLLVVVCSPYVAAVLYAGAVPSLRVTDAAVGFVRAVGGGSASDPASAFPAEAARAMPAAVGWWAAVGWTAAVTGSVAAGIWRRVDAYVSQASLARRPYELRGSRQRTWGRPRDLGDAVSRSRERGRFTLGRLDGRYVLSDPEGHVALIAPTRSGKTTRYVIPWLLEHDGPAIVTSTKLDVVEATAAARRKRGTVWVWDPFGAESATWSPLRGCEQWSYSLAQAQWIADASGDGDSEIAAYWRGEAAKLLAPLLHAAALDSVAMTEVLNWIDSQELERPSQVLSDAGRDAARRQLAAVAALDPRNRGTTYMSAGSLLAAYRYPELERPGPEIEISNLFNGGPNTLYIVANARAQRLLAPLVVGLVSAALHEAAERTRIGERLAASLRLLLDEAANIAPLRDLPSHLSQAAGNGVRIATVWQSLAQIHERYGRSADSVLANSVSKLFMGPVTDGLTRKYIETLVGEEPVAARSRTSGGGATRSQTDATTMRSAARSGELQQLGRGATLVVAGSAKPIRVSSQSWFDERGSRPRSLSRRGCP